MRGVLDRLGWLMAGVLAIIAVLAIARVVGGGQLDPPAPPGSTDSVKLPGTPISSLPFSIDAPGHYYVTRDLTGVTGQHGISINANDVSVDLGGFTLRGVPGSLSGVYSPGTTGERLTIRHGVLSDWGGKGIGLTTSNDVLIEDVRVRFVGGIGIDVPGNAVLRDCYVIGSGGFGITIEAGEIENCESHQNTGAGVQVDEFGHLSDVIANDNGGAGMVLGQGTIVNSCIVARNDGFAGIGLAGAGIELHGCVVMGNAGLGLEIGAADVLVTDSVVSANTGSGIYTEWEDLTIRDSLISDNGGDGIVITDHAAHLVDVTLWGNAGDGAELYAGSVEGCDIRGNGAYGINASGVVVVSGCELQSNVAGDTTNAVLIADAEGAWSRSLAANNGLNTCSSTRFECVLGGTAVLDRQTGLVWERDADDANTRTWAASHAFCATRQTGAVGGWRLPAIEELFSLITPGANNAPAGHPFQHTIGLDWWSATTSWSSSTDAVGLRFGIGGAGTTTGAKTGLFGTWCVRGGTGHDGM